MVSRLSDPISASVQGEVYRAHDTKLDRDVAIKVLPEEFANDKERLVRFEREAKLLASLNHPNIATIHGLEESEGVQFLVLEVVEGETLGERIARGPLSVEEALRLFQQIAEGVEAAHEKGIIHRDLKPDNLMLSDEGRLKILDFGLAKLKQESAEPGMSERPTQSATQEVRILGTFAYMSPELAEGFTHKTRTDHRFLEGAPPHPYNRSRAARAGNHAGGLRDPVAHRRWRNGEVYRARDTKLDREVTIKVLPEEFANDDERLAQFEREAKLLASLNHPNIASIYGFDVLGAVSG